MESAFRTFTSALGVAAACYLLSTATWQQVLLLFMIASFGWCWFTSFMGAGNGRRSSRAIVDIDHFEAEAMVSGVVRENQEATSDRRRPVQVIDREELASQPEPVVQQAAPPRVQRIYRFPIQQLSRPTLTPIVDFE